MLPVLKQSSAALMGNQDQNLILFAEFLRLDVANGDARPDTIRTYKQQMAQYVEWCAENNINPSTATRDDVKRYRQHLIDKGLKHSTIALKLTTVRRFYAGLLEKGMVATNPAEGVRPPRQRRAVEDNKKYLTAGEAEILFRTIPKDGKLKTLRDRALIALMALEGLRTVEIERAQVGDLDTLPGGGVCLLVHGKGRDGYIYPQKNTVAAIKAYLEARGPVSPDEPLFITTGNRAKGKRMTRDGIRFVVNHYLELAGLKRPGLSCHALRHTCGTLLYQATKDIRVVQEVLRHADIRTTARYSHVVDRGAVRHTEAIPVNI